LRDAGDSSALTTTEVHTSELEKLYYTTAFVVTDFPANSLGNRFFFRVKVYTDFASDGVESGLSASIILGGVPDKPSTAPTRNTETSEHVVAVNIVTVSEDNGSTITSYNIEVDDGLGGDFVELQGQTFKSMLMTGKVSTGVQRGLRYRFRYRAMNEVGFGQFSDITYILAASKPV
jgi:hypothetical protein